MLVRLRVFLIGLGLLVMLSRSVRVILRLLWLLSGW